MCSTMAAEGSSDLDELVGQIAGIGVYRMCNVQQVEVLLVLIAVHACVDQVATPDSLA